MSKFKKKYSFSFKSGDLVEFSDLKGRVTWIDDESEYGIEAGFTDLREKPVTIYFNAAGKFKYQDSRDVLTRRKE